MKRLVLCLAFLLVACGTDGDEAQDLAAETEPPAGTPAGEAVECEDRTPPAPEKISDAPKTKPDVEIPNGAPPCKLVIQDIRDGTGTEVKEGGTVTVQYVGVSWSTGEEFDSSWESPQPATFPLDRVVQGWQDGIPGMKEGGRRRLIIPPDLAYGDQPPPGIEPNETLVFVIDLLEVG
jgi:peptidylprolyl isomerase